MKTRGFFSPQSLTAVFRALPAPSGGLPQPRRRSSRPSCTIPSPRGSTSGHLSRADASIPCGIPRRRSHFCAAHVHPHGGLVVVILFSLFAVHVFHAALRQPVPQVGGLLVPSDGLLDVRRHGENSCMGYSEYNPRNPSQTFGFFSSARALDSLGFLSVATGADDLCLFSIFIIHSRKLMWNHGAERLVAFYPWPFYQLRRRPTGH